jgi:hypothetical protein
MAENIAAEGGRGLHVPEELLVALLAAQQVDHLDALMRGLLHGVGQQQGSGADFRGAQRECWNVDLETSVGAPRRVGQAVHGSDGFVLMSQRIEPQEPASRKQRDGFAMPCEHARIVEYAALAPHLPALIMQVDQGFECGEATGCVGQRVFKHALATGPVGSVGHILPDLAGQLRGGRRGHSPAAFCGEARVRGERLEEP